VQQVALGQKMREAGFKNGKARSNYLLARKYLIDGFLEQI
jgi:hypothetical protein